MLSKNHMSLFTMISMTLICIISACDGKQAGKYNDPNSWIDEFNSDNGDWKPITFEGDPSGSYEIDGGTLFIDASGTYLQSDHTYTAEGVYYVNVTAVVDGLWGGNVFQVTVSP